MKIQNPSVPWAPGGQGCLIYLSTLNAREINAVELISKTRLTYIFISSHCHSGICPLILLSFLSFHLNVEIFYKYSSIRVHNISQVENRASNLWKKPNHKNVWIIFLWWIFGRLREENHTHLSSNCFMLPLSS